MDWWEWTKIGGATALACGTLATGFWFAGMAVPSIYPQQQAYPIEGAPPVDLAAAQREWPTGGIAEEQQLLGYIVNIEKASVPVTAGAPAPVEEVVPLATLLASADPERGRKTAQACMACHDVSPNGPHGIGPNLWGVFGRPIASHPGFAYSSALKSGGGEWSAEQLDRFLASPGRAVPGTRMAFAGVRNPRDRSHLLAYLATLGASRPLTASSAGGSAN